MIKEAFPDAKIVFIHRNPLNVAVSLRKGKVMPSMSLTAAANYWNDSFIIMKNFKKFYAESVIDVPYLSLTTKPHETFKELLLDINEDPDLLTIPDSYVYEERNPYLTELHPAEQNYIREFCSEGMLELGYD